jgi:hypothetical protein
MPPLLVKPLQRVADKWERRANAAGDDYSQGVQGTSKDWAQAAAAAEPNYKQGVTAAANAGRYGSGVKRAGVGRWRDHAISKGVQRYGPGVSVAKPDYTKNWAPYHDAISRVDAPARGPRGADGNYQRTAAVGRALHQLRTSTR